MINLILNQLFPDKCPICKKDSDLADINPFCSSCWQEIFPYNGPRCCVCGIPAESQHVSVCSECLYSKPFYDKLYFYGLHDKVLKEVIHFIKYHSVMRLSLQVANLIATLDLPEDIELIMPVPLHKSRLLQRGFNQSANIAYHFSRIKGIQYRDDVIRKVVNTPPQSLMHREQRLKNMKGKFKAIKDLNNKTVALFDDVVTTTATVNECAKVLKNAGAKKVYVVSVARSFWI